MPPGVFQAAPPPKPIMPAMTKAAPLSKASKFAVDFFRTEKRLQLEDEMEEARIRDAGGVISPSLGLAVRSVNVVNAPASKQIKSTGLNMAMGGINGSPPPHDHFPQNPPPPRGGDGGGGAPPPPYTRRKRPRGGGGDRFQPYPRGGGGGGGFPPPYVAPPVSGPGIATIHPTTGTISITDTGNISNIAEAITSPAASPPSHTHTGLPEQVPNPITALHPPAHSAPSQLNTSRPSGDNAIDVVIRRFPGIASAPIKQEQPTSMKAKLVAPSAQGRWSVKGHMSLNERTAERSVLQPLTASRVAPRMPQAARDANELYGAALGTVAPATPPPPPNPVQNLPQTVQNVSPTPLMVSTTGVTRPALAIDDVLTKTSKRRKTNVGNERVSAAATTVYQRGRQNANMTVEAKRKRAGLQGTGVTSAFDAPAYVNAPQPIANQLPMKRKDDGFPQPPAKRQNAKGVVRFALDEPVSASVQRRKAAVIPISKQNKGKKPARSANQHEYDPTSLVGSSGGGSSRSRQELPELAPVNPSVTEIPVGTGNKKAKGKGKAAEVALAPLGIFDGIEIPPRKTTKMKGKAKAPKGKTILPPLSAVQSEPVASRTRSKTAPVASRTRSKRK
ncbi:hypothetical protein HDV00_009685 [Rhizophlyctis rosea]|nr:hypothetical protein HDV00_009685 [Rhizophlyctis rosea]